MTKQFFEKQFAKEVVKEHKEKEDKEKEQAKDFKEKEQKDTKEKEQKDVKDKEHSKDVKDVKERKETHKEFQKEGKELAKEVEGQPFQQSAQDPAAAASRAPALKFEPDKYYFEKYLEKTHPDKLFYEKAFKDKDKDIYEGFGYQNQGDPALMQRVAALETVVGQLMHFIPAEMRPDLSTGALSQEPEAKKTEHPQGQEAPPEKGKK